VTAAENDNTVWVWNTATGQKTLALFSHSGSITGVAFSPDGELLLTGSMDGTIKVWNVSCLD
jgi:WD40 repeat protein